MSLFQFVAFLAVVFLFSWLQRRQVPQEAEDGAEMGAEEPPIPYKTIGDKPKHKMTSKHKSKQAQTFVKKPIASQHRHQNPIAASPQANKEKPLAAAAPPAADAYRVAAALQRKKSRLAVIARRGATPRELVALASLFERPR